MVGMTKRPGDDEPIAPMPTTGLPYLTAQELAGIMHAGVGTLGSVAYHPDGCLTCARARDIHADLIENGWAQTGLSMVILERRRQPSLGFDAKHDEGHADQLVRASAAYSRAAGWLMENRIPADPITPWPWDRSFWKPGTVIKTAVKAAALALAAVDELVAKRARDRK